MKYEEEEIIGDFWCEEGYELTGRHGEVSILVIRLKGGYIRVVDVCEEGLQEDGLDIDVIVAPGHEKEALALGEWYSKYWTKEPPKRLRKYILKQVPFEIPKTNHGGGMI